MKFNGEREDRDPPIQLSGFEIFDQVRDLDVEFGKDAPPPSNVELPPVSRGRRPEGSVPRRKTGPTLQWKKRSIFFDLPYWGHNQLRHCLDVMHIEKNVGENVLHTIMNDGKNSKDHLGARKDLQAMGIRQEAWPDENDRFAPAKFTLTKRNKELFLRTLKDIKVPDGYASNISRCVDLSGKKISGLKSHDYHVLLQQFLPLAVKHALPEDVSIVLADLSYTFRQLCAKVLDREELDRLQEKIVMTLCHLEMIFPPSFFTSQVHLIVHLVHEAKMGGPVHYRWMYPIERYLGKMKSYVRNRAASEGCIAEWYSGEEAVTFIGRYFEDMQIERPPRIDDNPTSLLTNANNLFPPIGKPVGAGHLFKLTYLEKMQMHRHVLTNCSVADSYRK